MREKKSERLARQLRALKLGALHRATRLKAQPRTAVLTSGLRARVESAERFLARDARLDVDTARTLGALSAVQDALTRSFEPRFETEVSALLEKLGALRAERIRLDARLAAEVRAIRDTQRLLNLRLAQA